jgi:hypothetical protein
VLVADLLVHDQRAIRAVRDLGRPGISLGYDAEFRRGRRLARRN